MTDKPGNSRNETLWPAWKERGVGRLEREYPYSNDEPVNEGAYSGTLPLRFRDAGASCRGTLIRFQPGRHELFVMSGSASGDWPEQLSSQVAADADG